MKSLSFIFAFLFAAVCSAQTLTASQKQFNPPTNLLQNPNFQSGKSRWSAPAGGTFTIVTSGSNLLFDSASATFDASATSQYVQSSLYAIPEGLENALCEAKMYYKGGDANYKIRVLDGSSNEIATRTFESAATDTRPFSVYFTCPGSGSIRFRLESTADGALVAFTKMHLGEGHTVLGGTAKFFGSQRVPGNTGCTQTIAGSFTNVPADTDCGTPILAGNATASAGKIPGISFASLPAGDYLVLARVSLDHTSTDAACSTRLTDGTSFGASGLAFNQSAFSPSTMFQRFSYTAPQPATTFQVQVANLSGTGDCVIRATSVTDQDYALEVYHFPTAQEQAMSFHTYAWMVDSTITSSSGGISLATADQLTFVTPNSANLTLLNNPSSISAKITCSSTNPPTGTTCAAGNEEPGINFDVPAAQDVEVCFQFGHEVDLSSTTQVYGSFAVSETASNSQTIIQDCGPKVAWGDDGASAARVDRITTRNICGTCSFSTAGNKTVRLMYSQDQLGGTIQSNTIFAQLMNGTVQSSVRVTARPLRQQVPAPVLFGAGDYQEVASTTDVPFGASNVLVDVNSIALGVGDWDCQAAGIMSATASVTDLRYGMSTTSGNSTTGLVEGHSYFFDYSGSTTYNKTFITPIIRANNVAPTTWYLKVRATYGGSTPNVESYSIKCRRWRQ